jgi:hypothetical protein
LFVGQLVEEARKLEISLLLPSAEIALAALREDMEANRHFSALVKEDSSETPRRTLAASRSALLDQMAAEIGVVSPFSALRIAVFKSSSVTPSFDVCHWKFEGR